MTQPSEKTSAAGKAASKGARRKGRTLAFQALYGHAFAPAKGNIPRLMQDNPAFMNEENIEARAFAFELLEGALSRLEEIDRVIQGHSQNWKIDRIARVELAILRLGLYELMYQPDIPLKVAINEAVELAKRFGDGNSRNFVNGILDAVARDIDNGRLGIEKKF